MFILIGNGPDFLMRQGLVEVFHKGVVRVQNDAGLETCHESTSDRSLWVVAKVVAGYLRANGVGLGDINRMVFVGMSADISSSGRTIELSMKLPDELTVESREGLGEQFVNFIKQFFNNVKYVKPEN